MLYVIPRHLLHLPLAEDCFSQFPQLWNDFCWQATLHIHLQEVSVWKLRDICWKIFHFLVPILVFVPRRSQADHLYSMEQRILVMIMFKLAMSVIEDISTACSSLKGYVEKNSILASPKSSKCKLFFVLEYAWINAYCSLHNIINYPDNSFYSHFPIKRNNALIFCTVPMYQIYDKACFVAQRALFTSQRCVSSCTNIGTANEGRKIC